jgi:hypothetical protein
MNAAELNTVVAVLGCPAAAGLSAAAEKAGWHTGERGLAPASLTFIVTLAKRHSREFRRRQTTGEDAQYCQFSRRTGVPPVLADGLPACRFIGGQAGRAVCPHRRDACSPIKEHKTDSIGRGRPLALTAGTAILPSEIGDQGSSTISSSSLHQ